MTSADLTGPGRSDPKGGGVGEKGGQGVDHEHHTSARDTPAGARNPLILPHGDPAAAELTVAIQGGDLDALRPLIARRPDLASARMIGRKGPEGGWSTPLHICAGWPGYYPNAPAAVVLLLHAGADPNDDTGGDHPETPLHWAASNDDVEVAAALVDGGAGMETPNGSIGTPLDNAIGYGCWNVARLLVDRGAVVAAPWHAAALGMLSQLEELLGDDPDPSEVSQAFWHACSGAQRRAAEYLLGRGADLNWVPDYAEGTPLDAASGDGTRRENVVRWLGDLGAESVRPTD